MDLSIQKKKLPMDLRHGGIYVSSVRGHGELRLRKHGRQTNGEYTETKNQRLQIELDEMMYCIVCR